MRIYAMTIVKLAVSWSVFMMLFIAFPRFRRKTGAETQKGLPFRSGDVDGKERTGRFNVVNNVVKGTTKDMMQLNEHIQWPGADGRKINLDFVNDDPRYERKRNELLRHGVNMFISDVIGTSRTLRDLRPDACKNIQYPKDLPPVSVVIVCRDEPVGTLSRTFYGLLKASPDYLLKEIILVDDGSVDTDLLLAIKIYAAYIDKLKVVRNENSTGLMRARQRGIEATTTEYFIVMDSHMEFNTGWLEPIIHRLVQEPMALLTSHIATINMETFEYTVGSFDEYFMCFEQISLGEKWARYSDAFRKSRNESVEPIESCMVLGMMMAMRKDVFFQMGGFDTGMEVWGSEHMEISVRYWVCGGRVELVPCSIVGHLYRHTPWQRIEKTSDYITKNKIRFAEVWMDGFPQKLVLNHLRKYAEKNGIDIGDLSERRQLKIKNKCSNYNWFISKMKSISDDLYFPDSPRRLGKVYNRAQDKCLDCSYGDKGAFISSYSCHGADNQFFVMTENGQIKVLAKWLAATDVSELVLKESSTWWKDLDNRWEYNGELIMHERSNKCLEIKADGVVKLETCNEGPSQKWEWSDTM